MHHSCVSPPCSTTSPAPQTPPPLDPQYQGTHNFHNFTVRKPWDALDAKRYMLSFRCGGVMEIDGRRWVKMVVVGQSFMMHQIRKMVGGQWVGGI